ncbi:hypothetical protein [Sphingomonas sp.]|uniref:hypothetical protein n=1 Tax=Sphingomonas sp. TaxID=28214 RepID=UPI003AFF7A09
MTSLDLGDPLAPAPAKALWLVTLADLALLLVGFLVLVQATGDHSALARGLRGGFGTIVLDAPEAPPMPVAAAAVAFASGSSALTDPAPLVAWARDALADPRVVVSVTGSDGSDVLLAADRARAVLAALVAAGLPPARLTLLTARGPARATLTLAFAGEPTRSRP